MAFACIIPLLWTYKFVWLAHYVAFQIRRKVSISSSNGCVYERGHVLNSRGENCMVGVYILLFIKLINSASNHPVIWSGKNDLLDLHVITYRRVTKLTENGGQNYSDAKQLNLLISVIFGVNVLLCVSVSLPIKSIKRSKLGKCPSGYFTVDITKGFLIRLLS